MGRKYGSSEDSGNLFKGEKKNTTRRLVGNCIKCAVAFAAFKVPSLQVRLGPLGLLGQRYILSPAIDLEVP